jgi:hypothetical protein
MSGKLLARAQGLVANLWTLVVPPTTWALHFLFCYVYAAVRCAKSGRLEVIGDVRMAIGIATVVALGVVVASGYVAWAHSQIEGDPPPYQDSTPEDRVRFLATAKLLLAGLSFIAIVFTALPAFMFEDCK